MSVYFVMITIQGLFSQTQNQVFLEVQRIKHFKNSIKVLKILASPMKVFPT